MTFLKSRLGVFLFVLMCNISLQASYIKWYFEYEQARLVALKEKKDLLVLLVEPNINTTKAILQDIFINQTYIKNIEQKYIAVLIRKNQKSSYPIELLYTLEYPTLFLLDNHELFLCKSLSGEFGVVEVEEYLNSCYR